mmetsp:Transcript_94134/g.304595  ORF Transcript_94134/g.304595 Transcript_94134/m.304595 type:complete len:454 (-) Transcript_94134:123-1484(-)
MANGQKTSIKLSWQTRTSLQPRVSSHVVEGGAARRIDDQHLADKVGELRRHACKGCILSCLDRTLVSTERRLSGDHVVEHTTQAPHVHLGPIGLGFHLRILDRCRQLDLHDLRQNLALALVVARDLVATIKGTARGVVKQTVTHQINDVVEVHVGDVLTSHRLHPPADLHALLPSLAQGVALVALLRPHVHDSCALTVVPWGIIIDAKRPGPELNRVQLVDLRRVANVRLIAACKDHLRGHRFECASARGGLHGAVLGPMARAEVDKLDERESSVTCRIRAKQYVVRLQVPVDHFLRMHMLHRCNHLLEDMLRLRLVHFAALLDQVAQLAALGKFHCNHLPPRPARHVALDVDVVQKLNDVRVCTDVLVHLHLLLELGTVALAIVVELHAPHRDHLHGTAFTRGILALVYAAISTGAQDICFLQLVVTERCRHRVAARRQATPAADKREANSE